MATPEYRVEATLNLTAQWGTYTVRGPEGDIVAGRGDTLEGIRRITRANAREISDREAVEEWARARGRVEADEHAQRKLGRQLAEDDIEFSSVRLEVNT
jgi:hypothetical protein